MTRGAKFGAKTKRNLLTEDEVAQLISSCKDEKESFVINVLLYTGMRISEFIHMNRSWIRNNFIKIPEYERCDKHYECRRQRVVVDWSRGQKVRVQNMWRVKVPEAVRSIPILPEVEPHLRSFFSKYKSVNEVVKNRIEAWKIVKDVARRAGINKRIFPHVLRGTFASLLAGKDFESMSIQAILGWKSIKTADEYVRLSPQRIMKMVKEKW
ncbi:MAG: tyrosine-type recombinase/integrase [Candidatus Methanomethyliaceae archaeon]